jgi:trimethylamine--corrinoid protein Co-methyltransferase
MARRITRPAPGFRMNRYPVRLSHPFAAQDHFPAERVAEIHDMALEVLERLGMGVLDSEARGVFGAAGALVEGEMVRIGRDLVDAALASAPSEFTLKGLSPARDQRIAPEAMLFGAGAGCPNATDRIGGRRPGRLVDYENALRLQQSFDVIHALSPSAEPQDVPINLRHLAFMRAQIALADKPAFHYARGRAQTMDNFELLQTALGVGDDEFAAHPWTKTVINTNSPRLLDRPMGQGILDYARAGQLLVITPFCLAGAMAPVTVEGALVLQHAEALAGITLAQLARPGAPVVYGAFGSNVDMKSGAPAFGTPEHMRMTLGSGQLARHIGLPWRSAAGTAANLADAQGAGETQMSLWAALLANANFIYHAAGWLEGGLTFGFEKFITDVETLQTIAHLTLPLATDRDALAWSALESVPPGGHFFSTAHTLARYGEAFYRPLVADLSNFGTWEEKGRLNAEERATGVWQAVLRDFTPPAGAAERLARIERMLADKEAAGGAPILD